MKTSEYYRIYNLSRNRGNVYGIYPNYNIHLIKNIQDYTIDEQIELFEQIILKNEWNTTDLVVAFGDNGNKFRYKCSTVNDYNLTEEEHKREKELEEYFETLDLSKILQYT